MNIQKTAARTDALKSQIFKPAEIKLLRSFKWRWFPQTSSKCGKQASTFLTHGTDAGHSANNHIKDIKTALGQNSGVANMSRNIRDSIVHTLPLSGTGNIHAPTATTGRKH